MATLRTLNAAGWLDRLWRDVVFGLRTQRKAVASTAALVLTLALGIAATSASFAVTNTLFLRPLPVDRPDELVRIYAASSAAGSQHQPMSFPDFQDLTGERSLFAGIVAEQPVPYNFATSGTGERIFGELVSRGYFSVLGIRAAAGRLFSDEEERDRTKEPVAVLSYSIWRRKFGGDMASTPDKILLNGHPVRVIGVAPEHFRGTTPGLIPDVWVPVLLGGRLYPATNWLDNRGGRWFFVTARLRPDVSLAHARAALDVLSGQLQRDYPSTNQGIRFAVLRESESRVFPMFRRQIFGASATSLGVAALVLLVACANVAGVLLVRAAGRRKEIGVRLAVGATRAQLVRLLLTEHALLSIAAGVFGVAIAYGLAQAVSAIRVPLSVPIGMDVTLDARVLAFSLLITVATTILFGLAPALEGTRFNLVMLIKDGDASDAPRQSRVRSTIVAAQIAVSLLLLVTCGMFFRSLQHAQQIDVGFNPDGVVMTSADLGMQHYSAANAKVFTQRLNDRLAALPEVASHGLASHVPFELRIGAAPLAPEGYTPPADGSWPLSPFASAGPGYFETMRIPIIEGREFTNRDVEESPRVVVVNDVFARQFWPDGRAVGRRLVNKSGRVHEVIGVVKRGKYLTLGEPPQPYLYFCLRQVDNRDLTIVARGAGDPKRLLQAIGDTVHALDPALPLYNVKTLAEHIGIALAPARSGAATLTVVGIIALVLTSLGIYGTVAHAVSRRTYEIGVRRALGAEDEAVAWLVVREAAMLVLLGLATGALLAAIAARLIRGFLYDVEGLDPVVFVVAPFVLFLVCVAAAWIPTRRALGVSAASALRYQ